MLQKLAKPVNVKTPAGVFSFLWRYMNTEKPFLGYVEQVKKLRKKGLVIDDTDYAIDLLKELSYFSLIGGYKTPFKAKDKLYKPHTKIEDIYALYTFDDDLRNIIFRYILKVEKHIKSLMSYVFCETHGNKQEMYLAIENYESTPKTKNNLIDLVEKLEQYTKNPKHYAYLRYQKQKYNNIPLWSMAKVLTLGTVSKMYSFLPHKLQTRISKEFPNTTPGQLLKMLNILTLARNICAHNERLYCYNYFKSTIDDTPLHKSLNIRKKNTQYAQGKEDLFAVIISLKYLLKKDQLNTLVFETEAIIKRLHNQTNQIQQPQLYRYMGFPENWKDISSL